MLVTTTNTLQGIEIKKYLKPVSAHVVAGTGFLSDFNASFSDIFGGRSGSYQRQLQSLYDEAISKLKQQAIQAGANGIIGLSIDMDEISGKGKAMFMVTAMGTSVLLDQPKLEDCHVNSSVPSDYYDITYSLIIELKKLERDKDYFISVDRLYPLLDAGLLEAMDLFTNNLKVASVNGSAINEEFKNKGIGFLRRIPFDYACDHMYDLLAKSEKVEYINLLKFFIESAGLIDFNRISEMLNSNDIKRRKAALRIATLKKESFSRSDALFYQKLVNDLPHKFAEIGSVGIKKGSLLSKEKEIWNCPCGKEENSDKYCSKCGNDIYGFASFEVNQDKAIALLKDRVDVLNFIFK